MAVPRTRACPPRLDNRDGVIQTIEASLSRWGQPRSPANNPRPAGNGSVGQVQNALAKHYPDEFAGLWIEHKPVFRVVVAMTSTRDEDVHEQAGELLWPSIVTRVHRRSLAELESAAANVRLGDVPYSSSIDVINNQVDIDVLSSGRAQASAALADVVDAGLARVDVVVGLPVPVAEIYGGLNLDVTCGGLQGTSGFSVKKNGSTVTGVVTAGHLADCLKYGTTNLTFQSGSTAGNADAQWHTTTNLTDAAKFRVNSSGTTRLIRGIHPYNDLVIGELVSKYGRTTGYGSGTIEAKTVDPDGGGPHNAVFVRVQRCGGPSIAEPGDSGGPVFSLYDAVGIVTHNDPGDIFCSYKMVFNSVTHIQPVLGVSILLAP